MCIDARIFIIAIGDAHECQYRLCVVFIQKRAQDIEGTPDYDDGISAYGGLYDAHFANIYT